MTSIAKSPIQWPVATHPSEQEFTDAVGGFLGYVLWTTKKLCRGDLWRCAVAAQADLKGLLLQMIEWHAHAINGLDYETWYLGRYLDQWADRRVVSALPSLFPHYERGEMWIALVAMMELYGWLGKETAARLGYAYPADMEERVGLEISRLRPQ
jgi:aminoglycoside 6-adenylyltransferase